MFDSNFDMAWKILTGFARWGKRSVDASLAVKRAIDAQRLKDKEIEINESARIVDVVKHERKFAPVANNLVKGKKTFADGTIYDGIFSSDTGKFIAGNVFHSNGAVQEVTFDNRTGLQIKGVVREKDGTVIEPPLKNTPKRTKYSDDPMEVVKEIKDSINARKYFSEEEY